MAISAAGDQYRTVMSLLTLLFLFVCCAVVPASGHQERGRERGEEEEGRAYGGAMEFFGFKTSSKGNHPQFLAGASSVVRRMRGRELAAAFGVCEERLGRIVEAQRESIILPASNQWEKVVKENEEEEERRKHEEEKEKVVEELILIKRGFLA